MNLQVKECDILSGPEVLYLDEHRNQYYGEDSGIYYDRVNTVIKSFTEPFPKEIMAEATAKKRNAVTLDMSKKSRVSQATILAGFPKYKRGITKEQVLLEWQEELTEAGLKGTLIHGANEEYCKKGTIRPEAEKYSKFLNLSKEICSKYKIVEFERKVSFSNGIVSIAGSVDEILYRKSIKKGINKSIIDIADTKTNGDNFSFDSTRIDFYDKTVRHYDSFFTGPIAHLENCYYNQTAIQLSMYAYFLEPYYRIGKLFAKVTSWREPEKDSKIVPIPYLRSDVINIIEYLTMKYAVQAE